MNGDQLQNTRAKTLLYWIGSAASLISVFFVGAKILEYGEHISISKLQPHQWVVILCLAVGFCLSSLLLACAWRMLLQHLHTTISLRLAFTIYGVSQLAKYLPGNIFHLAGRQAIGMSADIPGRRLAATVLWEIGAISISAAPFAILTIPILLPDVHPLTANAIFVVVIALLASAAGRLIGKALAKAICLYLLFLILSGGIFMLGLATVLNDIGLVSGAIAPAICGAYVIAWLAGLLTPGAPAGLGVREVVLFALLQGTIANNDLLSAILVGRLVTAAGDLCFFLIALALKSNKR